MTKPADRSSAELLLQALCRQIDRAVKAAEQERKSGDYLELLLMRMNEIRVEMRQETAPHKEPHIHVKHSDEIDASLSLKDFRVLAGRIDPRVHKHVRRRLQPSQAALLQAWDALQSGEGVTATEMISNMDL